MKNILLCIVVMLGFAVTAPAYNNEPDVTEIAPKHYISLPVVMVQEPTPTPSPFALSGHYSFARREWSAIATTTFDPLYENIGGKQGFNIELYGLMGGNAEAGIIGGGIGLVYPIHPRISLRAGLDVTKRGSTFEEFIADFKGFELGGTLGVLYWMRF